MVRNAHPENVLDGRQVSIAGAMASMSRDEATDLIRRCGGVPAEEPGPRTAFVVVGQEDWPVGRDGRIPAGLEAAKRLRDEGFEIRVLGEQEFLEMLHLAGESAGEKVRRLYTVTQLSRILKIPGRRIRSWVRRGLIRPARTERRLDFFDFRQMTELRRLRELTAEGVPVEEIQASLETLREWFPETESALGRIADPESQLLERLDDGSVAEPSGQLRLGFDAPPEPPRLRAVEKPETGARTAPATDTPAPIIPLTPRPAMEPTIRVAADLPQADLLPTGSAGDWTERAMHLEEAEDLEGAARAYEQALLSGGPDAEIAFNLGNTLYALGRLDEARARFRQAVDVDPEYVEAWNNLGGVCADLGAWDDAIFAATCALELAPEYADPHYNLAEAYAASYRYGDARLHANRYLRHDPDSPWAERLRHDLGIRK